jgi:hypothetical protein
MAGYTKEFLVDAFVARFNPLGIEPVARMRKMANEHYDNVGKDKFRIDCALDAAKIKEFKLALKTEISV